MKKKKRIVDEAFKPIIYPVYQPYKRYHNLHFHKEQFDEKEINQIMEDLLKYDNVSILKHTHTPSGIYPHQTSNNFVYIKVDDRQECVVPYLVLGQKVMKS